MASEKTSLVEVILGPPIHSHFLDNYAIPDAPSAYGSAGHNASKSHSSPAVA